MIRCQTIFLVLCLLLALIRAEPVSAEATSVAEAAAPVVPGIPEPPPPFQASEGKRQNPELKVSTLTSYGRPNYEQASFWVGNKRVGVRELTGGGRDPDGDQMVSLLVDNIGQFRFVFFGDQPGLGFGYPFATKGGTKPELEVDRQAGTITYRKQYLLPGEKTAEFSYTLKSLGDSKVELSWDLGVSQEELAALPSGFGRVGFWMISADAYRNGVLLLNGKPLELTAPEKLTKEATSLAEGRGLQLEFAPDRPLQSFSFGLPKGYAYTIAESSPRPGHTELIIRANSERRLSRGQMVIDLGVGAVGDVSAPEPVAGIDFWQREAMDVPTLPAANLMPNGSFEQGLRYWAWWQGGGPPFVEREVPKYAIAKEGKFGGKALLIREGPAQVLQSFPIPLEKDKTYTASFYAKAAKPETSVLFGPYGVIQGSKLDWQSALSRAFKVGTEWERFSVTFVADKTAVAFLLGCGDEVLIDGIQINEGDQPAEFAGPAVEGFLVTSDPDNMLPAGQAMDAAFEFSGLPGLKGEVELTVFDYYRQKLSQQKFPFTLDGQGAGRIALPYDAQKMGFGVFVVKAEYHIAGQKPFRDYYRFSIMDFLENKHATKNLFGNLCTAYRLPRGDDIARNYMRWGFGSTTYLGMEEGGAALLHRYRIENLLTILSDTGREAEHFAFEVAGKWDKVTPEREKEVEKYARDIVAKYPWCLHWAMTTETEGKAEMLLKENFTEWGKVQAAAARGIKQGNPNAKVLFDGGTSGFSRLRGYRETEGYFAATQGRMKWDAFATHPYGNLDGVWLLPNDLDAETTRFIDLAKKYGYGPETPIDYTEGFNIPDFSLPEWGLDTGSYDNFAGSRPTYDSGWREFLHAAWVARTYLICLKYWPHVRSFNIWASRPYLDTYLTPLSLCKVPNTLGHLLGKPAFKADVRPAAGVRGYVFEDEEGRGVAAIWSTTDKVERGLEPGPKMQVNFGGTVPECIDLMGNRRELPAGNGNLSVQLSPAPLFFRSGKGGADKLAAALNGAAIVGAGNDLKVAVQPTPEGRLEVALHNQTNRLLSGDVKISGTAVPFNLEPQGAGTYPLADRFPVLPGSLSSWKHVLEVDIAGKNSAKVDWNMSWFYVPHTTQPLPQDPLSPEWDRIPSIPLSNVFVNRSPGQIPVKAGDPGDLEAKFQMAWDKDNLYLRIVAKDDQFVITDPARWRDRNLYMHDGCAEVYFDTGANGRSNASAGFDLDDYRYVFSRSRNPNVVSAAAYRFREPDHQLAGGLQMPTKEESARGIISQFRQTADGYAYVMIFPQRYIEPLHLEQGWRAGFGLFLHDKDDPKMEYPGKGVSLATEPGAHCDSRPDLWPIMVMAP